MKEYLKGSQKFRTWNFEEAAGHYRAALEADSALTLAHVGLASIAAWEENGDLYREHTNPTG